MKKLWLLPLLAIFSTQADAKLNDLDLAKMFAPKIHFHPDEKYLPSSFEWFLERSRLVVRTKEGKRVGVGPLKKRLTKDKFDVLKEAPLKAADLAAHNRKEAWIDPMGNKDTRKGQALVGNKSPAPAYAVVFRNEAAKTAAIMYWTFYPYNGPFQGLSIAGKDLIGEHDGDWETLIVYVKDTDSAKPQITRLYFSRHGREFGEPMDPKDPAMEYEGTHPLALSAKGGHGLYPPSVSKKWTRKAADTVKKGPGHWNTWEKLIVFNGSEPWANFIGRWGVVGNPGPTGPTAKLLWDKTKAGAGTAADAPKGPRFTELRNLDAGVGSGSKKDRKLFDLSLSSHYSDICFRLENAQKQVLDQTSYKIMERKRLKKGNKELYGNLTGRQCVPSKVVEHKEVKGVFVEITKRGPKANGNLRLIVEGKEPF